MANKSRPKQVMFRLSEEEAKLLQDKIKESGKTQQEYILSAVLEKEILNTDGLKELLPELKRQGANLNQFTKKLNERGYVKLILNFNLIWIWLGASLITLTGFVIYQYREHGRWWL